MLMSHWFYRRVARLDLAEDFSVLTLHHHDCIIIIPTALHNRHSFVLHRIGASSVILGVSLLFCSDICLLLSNFLQES